MSPKCDECPSVVCTKYISIGKEESKSSSSMFVVFPQISVGKSFSEPKWKGCVYKRRKLHRSSLVLRTAVADLRSPIESAPNSACGNTSSVREDEEPQKLVIGGLLKYKSESYLHVNETSSSSKPNLDFGECSSFVGINLDPLREFVSAKDLSIFVLKSHGLLGGEWISTTSTCLKAPSDNVNNISQPCKVCRLAENPVKMLICDFCEQAFHLSCCKPKVKKVPDYEWHCASCFKRKRKTLHRKKAGRSCATFKSRKRVPPVKNLILLMLNDDQPYLSDARIGKYFQAEVPEWTGPVYDDSESAWFQTCSDNVLVAESFFSDGSLSQSPDECGKNKTADVHS